MKNCRRPQRQAAQSIAHGGESENAGRGNVVKRHRGDQTFRGAALRVAAPSQQATPSESNPAPATRATVEAAGPSSGEPTRSVTVAEGHSISAEPAPSSITAVAVCSVFMDGERLNRRQWKRARRLAGTWQMVEHVAQPLGGRLRPAAAPGSHAGLSAAPVDRRRKRCLVEPTIGERFTRSPLTCRREILPELRGLLDPTPTACYLRCPWRSA